MNKSIIVGVITLLSVQSAHATPIDGLFDTVKNLFGSDTTEVKANSAVDENTVAPNTTDMVLMLTNSLGVTNTQAEGGLGSLFNYAKSTLSSGDFNLLASAIPGVDSLLSSVPDISDAGVISSGFGGLLEKASKYSDSLGTVNELNKQFEALGLSPEMIVQFADMALQYLDTEEGQQAKGLLQESFSSIIG